MRVGVRIANFNVTWPLAGVKVYSDRIVISIFMVKKIEILKSNIVSIEPYKLLPVIGEGLLIKTQSKVKYGKLFFKPMDEIILWTLKNKSKLISNLTER